MMKNAIVFVDSGVERYQDLANGVHPGAEVFILHPEVDGIDQINQTLEILKSSPLFESENLAVHIISHGSPGTLYLGNGELSLSTLDQYIKQLSASFSTTTELFLYGCNVAAGDAGAEFLAKLQNVTGAAIAASTSLVGNAEKGGDWTLDVALGAIEQPNVLTSDIQATYAGTFDLNLGSQFQVNTFTGGVQRNQSIAPLKDGGFVVTWHSDGQDPRPDVYAQRYDASGNRVGSEFRVNTVTSANQEAASVTGLEDGGFIIAWQDQYGDGGGAGIRAQRYSADGSRVGGEIHVNTTTFHNQYFVNVEGLADGGFVFVFQSYDSQRTSDILARRYDANGNPQGNDFRVNTQASFWQSIPSLTALPDGGFVVVWLDSHRVEDIKGQRYDANGARVGGEFRVNTYSAGAQWWPDVVTLSDGGFLVTWSSNGQDGNSFGVYGQRYAADGSTVGGEFLVNTTTSGDERWSSATALQDGGFFITWGALSPLDETGGVHGQQYDAQGNKVGGEILINEYTNGGQVGRIHGSDSKAVVLLENGDLAFVWGGQSGTDDNGISARIGTFRKGPASPCVEPITVDKNGIIFTGDGKSNVEDGTAWNDKMFGKQNNDTLNGLGGRDELNGNAGNDTLKGGDGDDILIGGHGRDILTGGDGQDSFAYQQASPRESGDTITDFDVNEDSIDFRFFKSKNDKFKTDSRLEQFKKFIKLVDNKGSTDVQVNVQGNNGENFITFATLENVSSQDISINNFCLGGH